MRGRNSPSGRGWITTGNDPDRYLSMGNDASGLGAVWVTEFEKPQSLVREVWVVRRTREVKIDTSLRWGPFKLILASKLLPKRQRPYRALSHPFDGPIRSRMGERRPNWRERYVK